MKTREGKTANMFAMILLITFTIIFLSSSNTTKSMNINCSALVSYYLHDNYMYNGTIKFAINPNGKGYIAYSGSMTDNTNSKIAYDILRIIYFSYTRDYNDDYYKIDKFDIKKNINDSMPDIEFSKIIFDISSGPRKIKIKEEQNGLYSIGNTFSPVFMCVKE